jgi:hypothetical protein
MPLARALILTALALTTACSEPTGDDTGAASSTGAVEDPNPHVLVTAKLDGIGLCGFEGATAVRFIARRVGCEQAPPAPCTLEVSPCGGPIATLAFCGNLPRVGTRGSMAVQSSGWNGTSCHSSLWIHVHRPPRTRARKIPEARLRRLW